MTDTIMSTLNTFDLKNNNSKKMASHKHMAPPSPQLSQDDLVRGLDVLENKPIMISPSDSTDLLSPISPKNQDIDIVISEDEEEEGDIIIVDDEHQMEHDVAIMIYFEFMALIYWDIPGRSGIVLGGTLSTLVLTSYYSLLYVFAASLTILTGFNLIFVNAYNLIRTIWTGLPSDEFLHPYHLHINNHRREIVSRDLIEYYIHKSIDLLELVAQSTAKIVYVEDTKTTSLVCLLSAFIYFATSLVRTKVFFGLFVLALFTVPYFYEQHQDTVNEKVAEYVEKSKVMIDKYSTIVRYNSIRMYNQSIALVQQQLNRKKQQVTEEKEAQQQQQE